MNSQQTFYIWRLWKEELWGKEMVSWGVREEPIEVPIEHIVPQFNGCIDRSLSEIQEFLDERYPDENYIFEYEPFIIQFKEDSEKWKVD